MSPQAKALAARTEDAYSFRRYASWPAVADALLNEGYSTAQTEEIMRSKITRWAADNSKASYGRATSLDVLRFLMTNHPAILLGWKQTAKTGR